MNRKMLMVIVMHLLTKPHYFKLKTKKKEQAIII